MTHGNTFSSAVFLPADASIQKRISELFRYGNENNNLRVPSSFMSAQFPYLEAILTTLH